MHAGRLLYLCNMSIPANWEEHSFEDWKKKVDQELKGASFEETLQSDLYGIRLAPLYTDRPAETSNEEEDILGEHEQSGMQWQATGSFRYMEGSVASILQEAFTEQISWMRISGQVSLFLDQLAKEVPLPVTLCLEAESVPASEDEVLEWRDKLRKAKAHHPFLWSLEFDPIGNWARTGAIRQAAHTFDHLYDLIIRLESDLTDTKFIRVDAAVAGEAGAGPLTEIAYALSAGSCYLKEMTERGMELYEAAHLLVFQFSAGTDHFAEIAKLRAFRTCWRNLLEYLDPEFAYMEHPPVHVSISQVFHTQADVHNNLLRHTTAALSAILGGADVLEVPPHEEGIRGHRLAGNIQRLLRYESRMDSYAKAASGSYYLEQLTGQVAEAAWKIFCVWEDAGGCLEQLRSGQLQSAIQTDRLQLLNDHLSGKKVLIGVNKYVQETPELPQQKHVEFNEFTAILPWNLEQAIRHEQVAG